MLMAVSYTHLLTIAGAGGYPKDLSLYQGCKCYEPARDVTKKGGIIIALILSLIHIFHFRFLFPFVKGKGKHIRRPVNAAVSAVEFMDCSVIDKGNICLLYTSGPLKTGPYNITNKGTLHSLSLPFGSSYTPYSKTTGQ